MSITGEVSASVIPAQLGFLAIYNPSLGTTDETLHEQILYYTSKDARRRSRPKELSKEEQNERLRQIGLAQGMVDFGKNFSEGRSVDLIETKKSRIILYELEAGWWILASIDLTRLPTSKDASGNDKPSIEYSSREVKPAALLLQDLIRAHKKFLLHHAASVSALFVRNQRQKFIGIFGRFWDTFTATWNVLLHGNPAVKIYRGIKLAACGELGVGVGEEQRGSGERAVLEGFASNVEGLVDVVVAKFGEAERKKTASHVPPSRPWLGSGEEPTHEDGAIFLGVGALSRDSLRDITQWMEDLYTWGNEAYGVLDNPSSTRRKKVRKAKPMGSPKPQDRLPRSSSAGKKPANQIDGIDGTESPTASSPGVPSNLAHTRSNESAGQMRQAPSVRARIKDHRPNLRRTASSASTIETANASGKFLNYLKLGYGTHWSFSTTELAPKSQEPEVTEALPSPSTASAKIKFVDSSLTVSNDTPESATRTDYFTRQNEDTSHYLIGLIGDIEDESDIEITNNEDLPSRILLRTLTVELEGEARAENEVSIDLGTSDTASFHGSDRTGTSTHAASHTTFESQDRNKTKKLRVVVYINRPFIYTFLFEPRTDSLSWPTLYRSLHRNLIPLQKPLLQSTSYRDQKPSLTTKPMETDRDKSFPIYDLIWDPISLTISTSIPDIPAYSTSPYTHQETQPPWSRIEALTTHSQILSTFTLTRQSHYHPSSQQIRERTCKTSRGYWISWSRIPQSPPPSPSNSSTPAHIPSDPNLRNQTTNDRINFNATPNWTPKINNKSSNSKKSKNSSRKSKDSNKTTIRDDRGSSQNTLSPRPGSGPLSKGSSNLNSSATNSKGGTNDLIQTPNTKNSFKSSEYSGPAHPYYSSDFGGNGGEEEFLCEGMDDREVFLVRRSGGGNGGGGGWGSGGSAGGEGGIGLGWMAGMGVNTKRYVEGLLALGRGGE